MFLYADMKPAFEKPLAQKLNLYGFSSECIFTWPDKISFWKITLVHKINLKVVFKCWHEICSWQNYLAQKLHLNQSSSEWVFMWPDKISFWKITLVHKIHLNVVFKCWHEICSRQNYLAQRLHLNGFSSEWLFMWPDKMSFWKNSLVHKIHLNVVFTFWHVTCSW